MQTNDLAHEKRNSTVVTDRTECSVPCTTERLNEESCRLASTVSQETASTTTSENLKHAFSSPLQRDSSRNREQYRGSENIKISLKSCVISILSAKPCGMTQLKKKLLETKGVSVVGCRGSCAKQESVRYVNQEELSVLLKQICVYKPPGIIRGEICHCIPNSPAAADDADCTGRISEDFIIQHVHASTRASRAH
ncbi:hypothetical protein M9435_004453 [Picochlorum sp. BPE23]|nr:hypothetical protein M9435_004453 [Picochlorum sp. BPE23]